MNDASILEQCYPHIAKGLVETWHNTDTTERFLNSVLMDDRIGRDGLAEEAFAELMFVSDLNWLRRHFTAEGVEFTPDNFSFGSPY